MVCGILKVPLKDHYLLLWYPGLNLFPNISILVVGGHTVYPPLIFSKQTVIPTKLVYVNEMV